MKKETVATPLGVLEILSDESGKVIAVYYGEAREQKMPSQSHNLRVTQEITQYFKRSLRKFAVPIAFTSGTSFEQAVWKVVAKIPYGTTMTYGQIAEKISRPTAVRAVGRAVGKNPLPIIVPCHRVLGAGGKLTGYSGGIERKRFLLDLEGIACRP